MAWVFLLSGIRLWKLCETTLEENNTAESIPPCSPNNLYPLVAAKTDKAFKAFLDARNPTKQHSSTLESYLIKPVQRVLKYPLLLKELVSLTDHESEEHYHLTGMPGRRLPVFNSWPRVLATCP